MRCHMSVSLLVLGLAGDLAAAQQPGAGGLTAARVTASRSRAAEKREAEKRRRRVDFIDATTLSVKAAGLPKSKVSGTTVLTSWDDQTWYLLVRRTISSQPEVHARWDDLVIVRHGTGAIEMGDSLVDSRYRAPGERIGGKFNKSYQIVIRAGDIVRIPAAVPHSFVVSGAEALEYLVIKQRRQRLPIRWFGDR
jgi:mannose-6-phosphate isomerase-like protein (cupin superfamily)